MKKLYTFTLADRAEAGLLKELLEREGVACLVRNEQLFGNSPLLTIPSWIWNLIFPLAFALITLHFLLAIANDIKVLVTLPQDRERGSVQ